MHNGGTVGSGGGGGGRRSLRPRLRGALAVRCTRRIVSLRFFCIFRISIYPVANRRTKEESKENIRDVSSLVNQRQTLSPTDNDIGIGQDLLVVAANRPGFRADRFFTDDNDRRYASPFQRLSDRVEIPSAQFPRFSNSRCNVAQQIGTREMRRIVAESTFAGLFLESRLNDQQRTTR